MTNASVNETYLYTKGLKLGWFPWQPGEDCRSRTFTNAYIEHEGKGRAPRLIVGEDVQGCKFCRQEPLAEVDTPTQIQNEFSGGVSVTKLPEDADRTPFRDPEPAVATAESLSLEELQAELARRAEAEVTAPAINEGSRAVVEEGAPTEPTEIPSALPEPTPPEITKLWLENNPVPDACPVCEREVPKAAQRGLRAGKPLSPSQRKNSFVAHIKSQVENHGEPAHVEWVRQADTPTGVPA
jgi:hypothetical protein